MARVKPEKCTKLVDEAARILTEKLPEIHKAWPPPESPEAIPRRMEYGEQRHLQKATGMMPLSTGNAKHTDKRTVPAHCAA